MKRLITLSIILSSAYCVYAQDVEKNITLGEVTVKAAKVVNKSDGMIIYPTDAQNRRQTMSTAYLRNSHLPICASTTSTTQSQPSTIGEEYNSGSMAS
ncbi:putative uncharacterized protein [Prevotella sp. CAG:592]|nr:putative uncharacterized protein [Prevotella sp. CAG:592]